MKRKKSIVYLRESSWSHIRRIRERISATSKSCVSRSSKIKKFTASPLRLTPPVEKRFRSLCDFLDYDASEMLDRIVTNYMNHAKGEFGGEV